jgi:hypothetical protein
MLTSKNVALGLAASGVRYRPYFNRPRNGSLMAKPNYAFEKRQKELAKKQKKQEKLEQRKTAGSHEEADPETEVGREDETALAPAAESN